MKRAQGRTFTSYVGGGGHRLIWRLVGRTIVLLLFGEHDAVYRRAERLVLEIDDDTETLTVRDVDPTSGERVPYRELRQREGTLFLAYRDDELRGWGFAEHELRVLRALDAEDELLALEGRMASVSFERALNLLLYGHPDGEPAVAVDAALALEMPATKPSSDPGERRLERQLLAPAAAGEFAPVEPEFLRSVLDRPIEDWMVFLHPEQARLAARSYSGPARVRGPAGTGKTVVALHRAAHLARAGSGPVLFTTFVRTLPPVLSTLFQRLAPDVADRVEFVHLHGWARRFLAERGVEYQVDANRADGAFRSAWNEHSAPRTVLGDSGLGARFYREEVDWVVRGRGLKDLEEYLALARNGRGTPLSAERRRAVWALSETYAKGLRRKGYVDPNDLLTRALAELEGGAESPFRSVIVDEAQDLTEVGARLLARLGGDRPDGLLLVGDGQQSIYPGGYSLGSAGIDVRGRSTILRTNYRNTREVLDAAMAVVEDRPFDDAEDHAVSGRRDVQVLRRGAAPVHVVARDEAEHDRALLAEVGRVPGDGESLGDMAVLVGSNQLVNQYLALLERDGIPTQRLEDYDGRPRDAVKVGTYLRAKGLEFKRVLLPRLDPDGTGEQRRPGEDDEAYAERLDLLRRRLFVAMSRARDTLWTSAVAAPSALLRR